MKMKIKVILTNPSNSVRHDLGCQASYCDPFYREYIGEMMEMCGNYLKLDGHVHMFCITVQFLFWTKAIAIPTKSVTFKPANRNKQEREEVILDNEEQRMVYVRGR